jgi:diacylglycerol kinase family enzyme
VTKDKTPWHFLLNPAAGRGKALRRWQGWLPQLRRVLPNMVVSESTAAPGMAALAEATVRAGANYLVGVGGDGTHHDILNGIVAAGGLGRVVYAPLPLGTGNDWVRTLKTPRRIGPWLVMLSQQQTMMHGVGVLMYLPPSTAFAPAAAPTKTRYFLNVAGMAYDAEVVRRSETVRFKHRWLYPFMTLFYLRGFSPPTVRVEYGGERFEGPVHTINLGIGRYSGGGMRLVPQADPTSGWLALTIARQLPVWKIILSSWRFYTGTIGGLREVTTTRAKSVRISLLAGSNLLEADGELLGGGPVVAGLVAAGFRVVVAGG